MAESKDTTTASEGASLTAADLSSLTGQSKSLSDSFLEFHEIDQSDKDKYFLICMHCKCKVVRLKFGTFSEKEVSSLYELLCRINAGDGIVHRRSGIVSVPVWVLV